MLDTRVLLLPGALTLLCLALSWAAEPTPDKLDLSGIQFFPPDNPWNTDISEHPVHPRSEIYIRSTGAEKHLHPEFGTTWRGAPNGIPYVVVSGDQPRVPVTFTYADESDPGPYPIPPDAPIEGGPQSRGDRHILGVDRECTAAIGLEEETGG